MLISVRKEGKEEGGLQCAEKRFGNGERMNDEKLTKHVKKGGS